MAATIAPQITMKEMDPCRIISIKGDDYYPTAGYALSASVLQTGGATVVPLIDGTTVPEYTAATQKVKFMTRSNYTEVSANSDQSAVTVRLLLLP